MYILLPQDQFWRFSSSTSIRVNTIMQRLIVSFGTTMLSIPILSNSRVTGNRINKQRNNVDKEKNNMSKQFSIKVRRVLLLQIDHFPIHLLIRESVHEPTHQSFCSVRVLFQHHFAYKIRKSIASSFGKLTRNRSQCSRPSVPISVIG